MSNYQVELHLAKTTAYEESSFDVTAYYRNRDTESAITPTNVWYRVDCLSTEKQLLDWTQIGSPGTSNTITISPTLNEIQGNLSRQETKQIIVQADRGLSTQTVGKVTWRVTNLVGVQ